MCHRNGSLCLDLCVGPDKRSKAAACCICRLHTTGALDDGFATTDQVQGKDEDDDDDDLFGSDDELDLGEDNAEKGACELLRGSMLTGIP